MKKKIKLLIAVLIALGLWQLASVKMDEGIILPSPVEVFKRLWELFGEKDFVSVLLFSFGRIIKGFLAGLVLGTLLAVVAAKWENVEILFKPFVSTVKAVPVASFVVLCLFLFEDERLSVIISFLMVFPIIYTNVLQGIKSVDAKMTQMAKVYKMPFYRRIKYLWIPSVKPFLISGCAVASGLAWKSGVAAELIGNPKGSIGEALYDSKVYLETDTLLAWTVVIVFLSIGTEKGILLLLKGFFRLLEMTFLPSCETLRGDLPTEPVVLEGIYKSFGAENVISDFSHTFPVGVTAVLGESGGGKTTLLNLIMGIEKADSGTISGVPQNITAVFQEDRLCEDFTPLGNVLAITGKTVDGSDILNVIDEVGLGNYSKKRISTFSGGMKRRVAICRALCAQGELIILDEPFKGLDEKTKITVMETVKKYTENKIVILVTHDEEEAKFMGAVETIVLNASEKEGDVSLGRDEFNTEV